MEQSLQQRLQYQPQALNQLLFGLNNETVRQRPLPEKWSVAENIAHLGRYHEVFLERMNRIVYENNPSFERYAAENDPEFSAWVNLDLDELLRKFYSSRKTLNEYLFSISDDDIKKTGTHPYYGQWTINGWCEFFLLHESHHYFTILKLLPQIKAPVK
jgi:hypothetical protein